MTTSDQPEPESAPGEPRPPAPERTRPSKALVAWLTVAVVLLAARWLPGTGLSGAAENTPALLFTEVWIVAGLLAIALRRLGPAPLRKASRRGADPQLEAAPAQESPLRQAASAIGPARSLLLGLVLLLLFAGQMRPDLDLYPFSSWSMYTAPVDELTFGDYRLVASDGTTRHLPFADLVPTPSPRGFMSRLNDLLADASDGDQAAEDTLTEALLALLPELDQRSIEVTEAIEAHSCRVSDPTPEEPASCELVLRISVANGEAVR